MSTYQDLVQEFVDENKVQSNGLLIEQPTVVLTHSRNPGRGEGGGGRGKGGEGRGRERGEGEREGGGGKRGGGRRERGGRGEGGGGGCELLKVDLCSGQMTHSLTWTAAPVQRPGEY